MCPEAEAKETLRFDGNKIKCFPRDQSLSDLLCSPRRKTFRVQIYENKPCERSTFAGNSALLTVTLWRHRFCNVARSEILGRPEITTASTRLWRPAVLVKTRVWVGCSVSRAHKTWSLSFFNIEGFSRFWREAVSLLDLMWPQSNQWERVLLGKNFQLYNISKIQLVVYYQCCVLIGWATGSALGHILKVWDPEMASLEWVLGREATFHTSITHDKLQWHSKFIKEY